MKKISIDRTEHTGYGTEPPGYRSGLGYLLIGGGIGATLALLFAPKSGSSLRGDIADATRRTYNAAADKAQTLNKKAGDLTRSVRNKATDHGWATEDQASKSGWDDSQAQGTGFSGETENRSESFRGNSRII